MRIKPLLILMIGAFCGSEVWGQVPNILAIEPPSVNPGAGQVTLNLIGTGFPSGECFVYVNGGLIGSCGQSPSAIAVGYSVPTTAQTVRVQIGSPTNKSLPFPLQVGAASGGVGLGVAPGSPITVTIEPDSAREGSAKTASAALARNPEGPGARLNFEASPRAPLPPAARQNATVLRPPILTATRAAGTVSLGGTPALSKRAVAFRPVSSKSAGIQNAPKPPSNPELGLGTYVTGDFNNDGIPDIAALNVDGYLLILLGNGDGSFGGFNSYTPILGLPVALATGDFNNDGILDIAFTTTGLAAVMYGDGSGLFPTGTTYALPTSTEIASPQGLAAGDFNGDGQLDLAVATSLGMTILLNTPGNTSEFRVYDQGPAFGAALGDFDSDGYPDVAFGTSGYPYFTLGGADYLNTYVIPIGGGTLPIVGDYNNDGILDFAMLNGSSLGLFINQTGGFFSVSSQMLPIAATSGVIADLDHDGYLDLILGQDSGPATVLLGAAGLAFAPPAGDPNKQGLLLGVSGGVYGLGDFNNDGFVDTAQGTFSAGLYAELQSGAAVVTPAALNFGTQPEGVNSATQTIQLQNVGSLPLAISAINFGGLNYTDFGGRQNCGSSLAAGATCQTYIYFSPTATGTQTAAVDFYDNGGGVQGTQQSVQLNGTGVAVAVSPSSLNLLATYPVSSPPQTVTVTNYGKNSANINSVSIAQSGSDFSETTNCVGNLGAGASCSISVTYHSGGTSQETAALNIAASGSPSVSVGLSGQEQVSYYGFPVATPSAIAFPNVQVGAFDSMFMPFTVTNYGSQPLAITSIVISNGDSTDFFVNPGSCAYLVPSQSCQGQAIFYPHTKAQDTATITISGTSDGAPTPSATVSLAGSGTDGIPWLQSLSPEGFSLAAANKGFTLTVGGGNFQPTSVVQLGSKSLKTTAATGTTGNLTLTATVPANFITTAETALIKVVNAGARSSNAVPLPLTSAPVKNPKYANSADSPLNLNGAWQVNLAYLNQGSALDAVVVTGPNTLGGVLLGNGDGTFKSGQTIPPGVAYLTSGVPTVLFPVAAVVRDFNGDGKPDLAMISVPASVTIFLGNGDGTFSPSTVDPQTGLPAAIFLNPVGTVGNLPPSGIAADFNGDGFVDLIVSDQAGGQLWVLLGNGNGRFQTPTAVSAPGISGFLAGDFNGDNFIDLAVLNQNANTLTVLTGNGFGGFTPGASIGTGKLPAGIAAADFNGDGKLDVAVTNMTDGTVSIFTGSGAGTFNAAGTIAVGKGSVPIAAADLNSDGKADLVVGATGASGAVILLGSGTATFTKSYSAPTGTGPLAIAIGDLNADGRLDILTANRGAGTVSSLLSQK